MSERYYTSATFLEGTQVCYLVLMDSNVLLSISLNDSLIEEEDHSVPKRKRENERKKGRHKEEKEEREKPYRHECLNSKR